MSRFTRRDFLRLSLATVGTVAISTGLQGCLSSSSSSRADEQARQAAVIMREHYPEHVDKHVRRWMRGRQELFRG